MTRELDKVLMGASSRAAVHLLQAAKAQALMSGRQFVIPDDIKRVCRPVLRHQVEALLQQHSTASFAGELPSLAGPTTTNFPPLPTGGVPGCT